MHQALQCQRHTALSITVRKDNNILNSELNIQSKFSLPHQGNNFNSWINKSGTLFFIRYEDLQSVPIGTVDYPTTSCSVMSAGGLANGADLGSMAPPSARLPPRLVAKDVWSQGPEASREQSQPQDQSWNSNRDRGPDAWAPGRERPQEQVWNSGRERAGHSSQEQTWTPGRDRAHIGPDQAWMTGRDRGPEQGWAADRDRGQDQAWNAGRDPGQDQASSGPEQAWGTGRGQDQAWSNTSRDRGNVWRPGGSSFTSVNSKIEHGVSFYQLLNYPYRCVDVLL